MTENIIVSEKQNLIDVSIVIPCKNEVGNLKWTVDSIMNSQNHLNFEIILVDDASHDGSSDFFEADSNKDIYKDVTLIKTDNVGAAEARNVGAGAAKGKYLFFCDAHIKVTDRWLDHLVNTLKKSGADLVAPCIASLLNPNAVGYGQTWTKELTIKWLDDKPREGAEIPIAGGAALGITKKAFEKINGFDHLFQVWGKEDEELCLKAWLYGYRVVINPEVKILHLFREKHPYAVTAENVTYNLLCLAHSHFRNKRLKKAISIAKKDYFFANVIAELEQNSELIFKQRDKYFKERMYSDEYFFEKFNIPF